MPWQVESLARGSSVSRSHAWTTVFLCTARTAVHPLRALEVQKMISNSLLACGDGEESGDADGVEHKNDEGVDSHPCYPSLGTKE